MLTIPAPFNQQQQQQQRVGIIFLADKRSKYILYEANNSCASHYHSVHLEIITQQKSTKASYFVFFSLDHFVTQGFASASNRHHRGILRVLVFVDFFFR